MQVHEYSFYLIHNNGRRKIFLVPICLSYSLFKGWIKSYIPSLFEFAQTKLRFFSFFRWWRHPAYIRSSRRLHPKRQLQRVPGRLGCSLRLTLLPGSRIEPSPSCPLPSSQPDHLTKPWSTHLEDNLRGTLVRRPHLRDYGELSTVQDAQNNRFRPGQTPRTPRIREPVGQRRRGLRPSDPHERRLLRGGWAHGARGFLRERWKSATILREQAELSTVQSRLGRLLHGREHRQRGPEFDGRVVHEEVSFRAEDRSQSRWICDNGAAHTGRNQGLFLLHQQASTLLS